MKKSVFYAVLGIMIMVSPLAAKPVQHARGQSHQFDERYQVIEQPTTTKRLTHRASKAKKVAGYKASKAKKVAGHKSTKARSKYRAATRSMNETPRTMFGGGDIVSVAKSQVGNGAIYGRSSLWCATFMNWVLKHTGRPGTGSDLARSFASYGQRVSGPQVGAIAVMTRGRGGGHVGVVSGVDQNGNPIIISGNHRRRVAEAVYPRGRVYAYVLP